MLAALGAVEFTVVIQELIGTQIKNSRI